MIPLSKTLAVRALDCMDNYIVQDPDTIIIKDYPSSNLEIKVILNEKDVIIKGDGVLSGIAELPARLVPELVYALNVLNEARLENYMTEEKKKEEMPSFNYGL